MMVKQDPVELKLEEEESEPEEVFDLSEEGFK